MKYIIINIYIYILTLGKNGCMLIKGQYFLVTGKIKLNTICLPLDEAPEQTYIEYDVTVAGWGYTEVIGDVGNAGN